MDITLERILSLMEHDAKGKLKHGAKKTFAASIGYDCGNIVSMWISGESKSYLKKLHEIAAKYNVSVEWLKGETDEKNPSPSKAEGEGWKSELVEFISTCNDRAVLVEILKALTDRMSEMG